MPSPSLIAANVVALAVALASNSQSQCLDWSKPFGTPGVNGSTFGNPGDVWALATFDDGTGPKLYMGGNFLTAGDIVAPTIASWDGAQFRALGSGLPFAVVSLRTLDAGNGPRLYAGNAFGGSPSAYSWDGIAWTPLPGIGGPVHDFEVFDDGTGLALYALPDDNGWVYRRIGSTWSVVGAGVNYLTSDLQIYDDGTGPALYMGGYFSQSAGQIVRGIARWDGTLWKDVGGGVQGSVNTSVDDMTVFDDGSGPKLYACGLFTQAGAVASPYLAAWDGSQWSSVVSLDGPVLRVETVQIGATRHLAISGPFQHVGGVPIPDLALWDGTTWTGVAQLPPHPPVEPFVTALATYDDGNGRAMYASGRFTTAGGVAVNHIGRWDGANWSGLGEARGLGGIARAAVTHDDGSGKQLYVGGELAHAGPLDVRLVARFDGTTWSRVGTQAVDGGSVLALASAGFGAGPRLHAGGSFTAIDGVPASGIASWDGTSWSPESGIAAVTVRALLVDRRPVGDVLYAGGNIGLVGGVNANGVARFDGTSWSALGSGPGETQALAIHDDGGGPKLYAAVAGGIRRFDGATWTPIALAPGGVRALASFDDGSQRWLFAGGQFSQAGGIGTYNIARWDGTSWSHFGEGATGYVNSHVDAFRVHDDGLGGGPKLFAGGFFSQIGTPPAQGIGYSVMRFDGSSWQGASTGGGVVGTVHALEAFDDGGGPALFAVGSFAATNSVAASSIARYGPSGAPNCSAVTGTPYCAGDGSASACPCGNSGITGHGCQNASGTGGAQLTAKGQANLVTDDVTLGVSGTGATSTMMFFQGTSAPSSGLGVPFGDGLRCVSGQQVRLAIRTASAGMASFGAHVVGDPQLSVAGHVIAAESRRYQVWYRDVIPFCTGSSFNLSPGLLIRWAP